MINTNGEVVASALPLAEVGNPADRVLVRQVRKTRAFAMGDYLTGLAKGKPAVTFGYPVFDTSGRVEAVVLAWMRLDCVTRPGSALSTNVPSGAIGGVLTGGGTVGNVAVHGGILAPGFAGSGGTLTAASMFLNNPGLALNYTLGTLAANNSYLYVNTGGSLTLPSSGLTVNLFDGGGLARERFL